MILECPKCSARYKVDPALIPAQGKKVRCKKCDSIFKADSAGHCHLLEEGSSAGGGQPAKPASAPKMESPKAGEAQATQMLGAAATVMIDSAHIQAMVAQQRSEAVKTAPAPAPPSMADPFGELDLSPKRKQVVEVELPASSSVEMQEPDWGQELGFGTVQMQTARPSASSFATQGMRVVQPSAESPADGPKKNESPMYSELDQFHFGLPQKQEPTPASTSDSDLDSLDFRKTAEEEHASNTLMAGVSFQLPPAQADLPEPVGFADIESDLVSAPSPVSEKAAASARQGHAAPAWDHFEARIDRQIYPALSLEVIERWVREGRLLESDELRPQGSGDFQRADRFPEVSALFQRYFGKTANPPAKKKGFFARLFGR
jgi:predicted Zn finger-like uncharacterized protein